MTNSSYNAHTTPIFKHHQILTYDLLVQQGQLLFMHAIEYNYEPTSFTETWSKNRDREPNITHRNATDYIMPQPRTETLKKLPYMPCLQFGMIFHLENFRTIS
jgi:hypothetical protein